MTTIAYKDGVLASDSLFCSGSMKLPGRATKLFRIESGEFEGQLFAFCGNVCDGLGVLDAIESGADAPPIKHTTCIRIDSKGWPWEYESRGGWQRNTVKWGAWGSGSAYAYGALYAGATAQEAVKAAIEFDTSCRGPVKVLKVEK